VRFTSKVRRSPGARRWTILWTVLGLAALSFAAVAGWVLWPVTKDLPERLSYPPAPLGSNGLTAEERQQ